MRGFSKILLENNIRPSFQRLKIYEYLAIHKSHPTVDQIFNAIQKEVPTLSRSTVYNALSSFVKAGLITAIDIEDNETRYDKVIENHGHFKCASCGTIYNFDMDIDGLETKELAGFKINDKKVYFKGICKRCLSK